MYWSDMLQKLRSWHERAHIFDLNFLGLFAGLRNGPSKHWNDCCDYVIVRFCGKAPFADR